MSYVSLIPSMVEYGERFRQLDPLDFKIIRAMYKYGVWNVSRLAKEIGVPQQTVSYHVKRFDEQDIVRFRALIDEAKLGLKSYAVVASVKPGMEDASSRGMTCFPLWRYLAILDGWRHGCFVRYVIPPDKEVDLKAFLNELKKRRIVLDYDIFPTTSTNHPLLNLDFYVEKGATPIFDWDRWVKDYESFQEEELVEPASYERAEFDLYDLIILRCLEIDARMTQRRIVKEMAKILEESYGRFIPLVSRRLRERIMPQKLIRGYRAYLFPNPGPTVLLLMYYFNFTNSSSLRKFINGLNHLPYNTAYEKTLERDELFTRFIIPIYEWANMRKAITKLGETGHLKDAHLFLGDLAHTWDNVEIYQMYKDEAWNFSYGIAMKMLEKVLFGNRK